MLLETRRVHRLAWMPKELQTQIAKQCIVTCVHFMFTGCCYHTSMRLAFAFMQCTSWYCINTVSTGAYEYDTMFVSAYTYEPCVYDKGLSLSPGCVFDTHKCSFIVKGHEAGGAWLIYTKRAQTYSWKHPSNTYRIRASTVEHAQVYAC